MSEDRKHQAQRKMRTAVKKREAKSSNPEAPLPDRGDWIGLELRKVYNQTLNEPLPDRLKDLLSKLQDDEGEGRKS
jgi:hypothetical protein